MTDVQLLLLHCNTWKDLIVWKKKRTLARLKMLSTKCVYK